MHRVKTTVLLIVGVVFFVFSSLVRVGVVSLCPVRDASGAQIYRPDGRRLMESDTWGDVKVNWLSDLYWS